jgi:hypothetical protein
MTLFLTGVTIAAITRNERYHQFYAIFFLVQTVVISFAVSARWCKHTEVLTPMKGRARELSAIASRPLPYSFTCTYSLPKESRCK